MTKQLTRNATLAIAKYGKEVCIKAFEMTATGDGARTIAEELDLTTNQADAAIDAGRELSA